jgi:Flp pilus assembly protein TadB
VTTFLAALVSSLLVALALSRPRSIGRLTPSPAAREFHPPTFPRRAVDHDTTREFISVVIAELQVGRPVPDAVRTACDEALPRHRHQDITSASADPWLRKVAVILEVSAQTGAPAVHALEATMTSMAASQSLGRTVAAELAAPRYTAVLLALLPVLSWIFGGVMGVSPLGWLLSSAAGIAVLLTGLALNAVGLWAIHHIARTVTA